jgi:hypothetical protein
MRLWEKSYYVNSCPKYGLCVVERGFDDSLRGFDMANTLKILTKLNYEQN